jgi:sec-independent protein translocase protein TatA
MPNIGPLELVVVLIIALIVFGPKRLPELGRSLGKGIREFRGSVSGDKHDDDEPPELERIPPDKNEAEAVEGEVVTEKRA